MHDISIGVAVGAGEIEDETIQELAETKKQLEVTKSALSQAEEENQQLRARLVTFHSGDQEQ